MQSTTGGHRLKSAVARNHLQAETPIDSQLSSSIGLDLPHRLRQSRNAFALAATRRNGAAERAPKLAPRLPPAYHDHMFRIKICGITNLNDARFAAKAGADAIGLNFFKKSRRFVEAVTARTIAASLPANVTKVGVFVNHSADEITEIVQYVGLDYIQLHGDEVPQLLAQLPKHVGIVRAHRCTQVGLAPLADFLRECRSNGRAPDALLIDADAGAEFGGTGELADWALVARERAMIADLPLILAGGLKPTNVSTAIAAVRPDAVDVASGVERQAGIKDKELVAQFISAAKQAF